MNLKRNIKSSSLVSKDNREALIFAVNEFGYNFEGFKDISSLDENLYDKPKNIVNKDYLNIKR